MISSLFVVALRLGGGRLGFSDETKVMVKLDSRSGCQEGIWIVDVMDQV